MVQIEHFAISFGDKPVVRDLSFEVQAGETFGFLGSNGSGKTTTIRALLGIYTPAAGRLLIHGKPFEPGRAEHRSLGYLPEERGLYRKEPVLDTMVFFGKLRGMPSAAAKAWSQAYLERVGIPEKASQRLDRLSSGQQQKVQLGVAIMGNPSLLILDEPTKGFDPVNRRLLLDIIDEHKRSGATVIMVTHQLDDVERLCDRILLLKDGTARAYGTVRDVQAQFGGTTVMLACPQPPPDSPDYQVVSSRNSHSELQLRPGADPAEVLRRLIGQGLTITSFTPRRRSLESIFIEVYGTAEGA